MFAEDIWTVSADEALLLTGDGSIPIASDEFIYNLSPPESVAAHHTVLGSITLRYNTTLKG